MSESAALNRAFGSLAGHAAAAAILIVDDHEPNLVALEAVLEPLGHELVRAKSGEEALRQVLLRDFAVILLDVMMPGLDGYETAALIRGRKSSRAIPVIFITARSKERSDVIRGYAEGAVDYLTKPFDPDILRAKVSVFVELHEGRNEIRRQATALRDQDRQREELERALADTRHQRELADCTAATYQFVAENIPQQVWTTDPDGRLDYVNPVVLDYFAQTSEAMLGSGWLPVIHPDDLKAWVERWGASLTTGTDYEFELRLRRHDGNYRWHLGRAVAERGADGKLLRWFGTNTDIDDRKTSERELLRREAALADSEARLRLALDAGQMGDWEWNAETGVIAWSPALEHMHGLAPGTLAGTFDAYQRAIHPDDRDRVIGAIRRSIDAREPHESQYRIIRPDGEVRWLEARGKLVCAQDGSPLRLVGVCTDVTARRSAEATAHKLAMEEAARIAAVTREEGIRQIVESISDPMLILDQEWRISYINDHGATLLARPREALVGFGLWDLFPELVGSQFYDEYHRARRDHVAGAFEAFFPTLDTWFEVRAYPTRDGRLSIHYRSVNARKQAEAALARETTHTALRADIGAALAHSQTLAGMLGASAEAMVRCLDGAFARIWTLDADTNMLELQASAGMYTHLDGPHGRVPVGKLKIGRIAQRLEPHLTNDVPHDPEVGDPQWAAQTGMVAFAGYPLIVAGTCVGVAAMFSRSELPDDTLNALAAVADSLAQGIQRRRAEQALEARAQDLARSNAELERFAYVASHDLQEPLRMVASYTQLLSRRYKGKLDAAADEFIGFAVDGAERMQGLINDLLAFSRIGSQSQPPRVTSLEVPLAAALANLKSAIEESAASVSHDPLPSLCVDPHQFVQLFQNLIGNAIKFRGAAPPVIHVGAVASGSEWVLSVRDNGIGIAEEYFERLFVLFQRLHTRKEYPGNGIGLAICKKVVERHGGRMWVESVPDQGTTFFMTLKGAE